MIQIAPSILSADFTKLGADLDAIATADMVHFDVMDGAFVPNISYGMPICKAVNQYTDMFLDTHLIETRSLPSRTSPSVAPTSSASTWKPTTPRHRGRPERNGTLRREESRGTVTHHTSPKRHPALYRPAGYGAGHDGGAGLPAASPS